MQPNLSLEAFCVEADPTCMETLGCDDQFQIPGLHKGPPPVINTGYQQVHRQHTNPNVHH